MNLEGHRVWQVAAGNTDREYADLFLKWDVVAMGLGNFGEWPACRPKIGGTRMPTVLRYFCEDLAEGDLVVLRIGTATVRGVGIVVGGYEWNALFDDVDGWDLQHIRRIRWLWQGTKTFETYALKWGDTIQQLDSYRGSNNTVREWLETLEVADEAWGRPLSTLPEAKSQEVSLDEITDYLFDHGVASDSVKALRNQMDDLVRIARWYERMKDQQTPSEFETVAYLVLPLLQALGWTPQKTAIEWNHVDIALFNAIPRSAENLVGVVEAKRWGASCLSAQGQASAYVQKHGQQRCDRMVVTDGMRYGLFLRQGSECIFPTTPDAYLNLTRLRWSYPLLGSDGAGTALRLLSSEYHRA